MKKLIIFICILFLFVSFAFAQNETINTTAPAASAQRTAQPAATPDCNMNGVEDPGETCLNCPDVRCKRGEICTETGECVKQASFTIYIIVGIGIFALLALFFVAKRLTRKPEEPLKKPEFMQQKPAQQPIQKPIPPKPVQQPQEPVQQSAQPMPSQQPVQMPPERSEGGQRHESRLPPQKTESAATEGSAATLISKPKEETKELKQEEESDEHKGETQIQAFIRQRRETGWTDEQIRQKMKETGWKDTQIALEFLKAPKFAKKR